MVKPFMTSRLSVKFQTTSILRDVVDVIVNEAKKRSSCIMQKSAV